MQSTILRYGLLSGACAAVLMLITVWYNHSNPDYENGAYFGYAGILLSMLFVFFGVRSYRDRWNGGALSFGKGFQVGILIALISCLCYVVTWMIVYETLMPDFMDKYMAHALEQMRQAGKSELEIQEQTAEMMQYKEMYKSPVTRFLITFIEPFPVALGVTLVSALVLKRRP